MQVLQAGDSELASARLQELTISWKQPDKLRRQDVTFMGARTPTSHCCFGFCKQVDFDSPLHHTLRTSWQGPEQPTPRLHGQVSHNHIDHRSVLALQMTVKSFCSDAPTHILQCADGWKLQRRQLLAKHAMTLLYLWCCCHGRCWFRQGDVGLARLKVGLDAGLTSSDFQNNNMAGASQRLFWTWKI